MRAHLGHGFHVEQAITAVLQARDAEAREWMARVDGLDELPAVRSWRQGSRFEWVHADALPAVYVTVTGITSPPERRASSTRRVAIFDVGVAVVAEDKGGEASNKVAASARLAQRLLAAYRTVLTDDPSLGGFADTSEWTDENYDLLADERSGRLVAAAEAGFAVHHDVDRVVPGLPAGGDTVLTTTSPFVYPKGT